MNKTETFKKRINRRTHTVVTEERVVAEELEVFVEVVEFETLN